MPMTDIDRDHRSPLRKTLRTMMLFASVVMIGSVLSSGYVHAQDDDDDDEAGMTFEQKLVHKLMRGVAGRSMDDGSIDYRERSPLVVPPKIELPPPEAMKARPAPNWPKDPDVAERAARKAANEKIAGYDPRPLMPSELAKHKTAPDEPGKPVEPGNGGIMLSPSQLGYVGGLFSTLTGKGKDTETAPFTGEPPRESLVQPPVGYQTPAPNYPYGTGKIESLNKPPDPIMVAPSKL